MSFLVVGCVFRVSVIPAVCVSGFVAVVCVT